MPHWQEENKEFTRLWLGALPSVRAYVISLLTSPSEADDAIQATALAAVDKYADYDASRPFVGWILGIARYEVLRRRRDAARDRLVLSPETMELIEKASVEVGGEFEQRAAALQACINELGEDARELVRLRYEQDGSVQSIADSLGRRANSVSMSLTRIRRALRACIENRLAEGDR